MRIRPIPPEKIAINKKIFHDRFIKYFQERLHTYQNIAAHLEEAPTSKEAKNQIAAFDWAEAIAQIPASLDPKVGPFISLGAKIVKALIIIRSKSLEQAKADDITAWAHKTAITHVEYTFEEVSSELQRIFEYQIGALADEQSVLQVACDAVDRILNFGEKFKDKLKFKRDILLRGVIEGKSQSTIRLKTIWEEEREKKKTNENNPKKRKKSTEEKIPKWYTGKIFSSPGVCKYEKDKNCYTYYEKRSAPKSEHSIYGFRGVLLKVKNNNYFIEHELDGSDILKNLKPITETKIIEEYTPTTFIVDKKDLRLYAEELATITDKNKIKEFNQFIAERYFNNPNKEITVIYRTDDRDKNSLQLNNSKFRKTDFTRADLQSANLYRANFQSSILRSANFRNAQAKKINLSNTECMFCDFSEETVLDEADLTQADMRCVIADLTTDMSDVKNMGTKIEGSTIHLANTRSILKQRLKELENEVRTLKRNNEGFEIKFPFWGKKPPTEINLEIPLTPEDAEAILKAQSDEPAPKRQRLGKLGN